MFVRGQDPLESAFAERGEKRPQKFTKCPGIVFTKKMKIFDQQGATLIRARYVYERHVRSAKHVSGSAVTRRQSDEKDGGCKWRRI